MGFHEWPPNCCVIPSRFADPLELHVAKINCQKQFSRSSLIYAIIGPPGWGKSHQAREVLRRAGVTIVDVAPERLEDGEAGRPGKYIKSKYQEASEVSNQTGKKVALMIEDIDTALGDWGGRTQYTVNRQGVITVVMALCDKCLNDKSATRIPMIVTGNSLSGLPEPLTRVGRMKVFEWAPTLKERRLIMAGMFPELSRKNDIKMLVEHYPTQPIAFFAQVRESLIDEVLAQAVTERGRNALDRILEDGGPVVPRDFVRLENVIRHGDMMLGLLKAKRVGGNYGFYNCEERDLYENTVTGSANQSNRGFDHQGKSSRFGFIGKMFGIGLD